MIRNLIKEDLSAIEEIVDKELVSRNDINYGLSGISIENNIIDSITIIGCQSLTDYFNGNLPTDLVEDEELGSQEIIAVYSADNTSETLWKTYGKYAHPKLNNYSLCWYQPIDENDAIRVSNLIDMHPTPYGLLIKRM